MYAKATLLVSYGVAYMPMLISRSESAVRRYQIVGFITMQLNFLYSGTGETYLPSYMVQKAWGMPKEEIKKYVEFDHLYRCTIGGDKCLTVSSVRHEPCHEKLVFGVSNQARHKQGNSTTEDG